MTVFNQDNFPTAWPIAQALKKWGVSWSYRGAGVEKAAVDIRYIHWESFWKVRVGFKVGKDEFAIEQEINSEDERCLIPEKIVEQLLRARPELLVANL